MNRKNLTLTVLLALISFVVKAQKPVDADDQGCKLNLRLAEEKYKDGKIDEVVDLIKPCVDGKSNLSKQDKISALKILTITYLYLNEHSLANTYMKKLLRLDSEIEVDPNVDPSEFINLYNQFRHTPVAIFGLMAGMNTSFVNVSENYSLDNTNASLGSYSAKLGFGVSAVAELPIFKFFSLVGGLGYNSYSFEYKSGLFDYSTTTVSENITSVGVPLSLRFSVPIDDLRFYCQLGASANLLLSSGATFVRLDSLSEELGNQTVEGPEEDLTNQKVAIHYAVNSAIGFYWKNIIGRGYLIAELGYDYGLTNLVDSEGRYSDPTLVYRYNFVPRGFTLDAISLRIGYGVPLYRPKLLKKYRKH